MAADGVVMLNRFGLEKGRVWPAVVMLVAVFAPLLVWSQLNTIISGKESLEPNSTIELSTSTPLTAPPIDGKVRMTIPGDGWSADIADTKPSEWSLVHGQVHLDVKAISGVDDIMVLFDRQARDLASETQPMFVTDTKPYSTEKDLDGVWGNLTGESYTGILAVVGRESVAAVVVVTTPPGKTTAQMGDIVLLLNSLEIPV